MSFLEFTLALCMGVGLSVAVGFRIFVPLLIISLASLNGNLTLSTEMSWIGTYPALVMLLIATIVEILAYYIPVVDNFLDTLSVPFGAIAGVIVTASFISDLDPFLMWSISIIAGASTATISSLTMATVRGISTTATAGFGNFVVSTFELIVSVFVSILSIFLPILALIVILIIAFTIFKIVKIFNKKRKSKISLKLQKG